MLENLTWNIFEKTGSVEMYLEYVNIKNIKDSDNSRQLAETTQRDDLYETYRTV